MPVTYTDREIIKLDQSGRAATLGGIVDPIGAVAKANSFQVSFSKASDDGMASTTTAETYMGIYFPDKVKLKSVTYVATTGGITADASNNATITISKRDSAGANKTTVASATTNVAFGNVTQGAGKALTLSSANVIITAGSTITFEIAKGGTGVVVRAGIFTLEVENI